MITACKHVIESKGEVEHETSADGKRKVCKSCVAAIQQVTPGSEAEQQLMDDMLVNEQLDSFEE